MEVLIVIAVIGFIIWIISKSGNTTPPTGSATSARPATAGTTKLRQPPPQVYRPGNRVTTGRPTPQFQDTGTKAGNAVTPKLSELEGLHDAFTGAPLTPALGLFQCQSCKVYYHADSVQVLHTENNSQCVSCSSKSIVSLTHATARERGGHDFTPNVVTLNNFTKHMGQVVTFESVVVSVRESRRGNDFAVMFERKSWTRGLKLVFFRGAARSIGSEYINSLNGKTVRVRGLLKDDTKFGPEIIVSEKDMILSVR